jgi:glycosyltransferase involved in cell wall biosynthesis
MQGHTVIHYGNEGSVVECDEHVEIFKREAVNSHADALKYELFNDVIHQWCEKVSEEISKRKEKADFLMCAFPNHSLIATNHIEDMIVVESGIGYPAGYFAPFKIFESNAIMHAYYGTASVQFGNRFEWYAHVIPNYFDPADFAFCADKEDYLLFLGMRHKGASKGYSIACDAARDAGIKLLVAGPDEPDDKPDHVEYLGLIDVPTKAKYLSKARALIAPSIFLEPFCGAQIEAYLSGTPCISTNWGAFTEYNIHGKTGFRCRTHREFVEAIDFVQRLCPGKIHEYAQRFTLENVSKEYNDYAIRLSKCFDGSNGWYDMIDDRLGYTSIIIPKD